MPKITLVYVVGTNQLQLWDWNLLLLCAKRESLQEFFDFSFFELVFGHVNQMAQSLKLLSEV